MEGCHQPLWKCSGCGERASAGAGAGLGSPGEAEGGWVLLSGQSGTSPSPRLGSPRAGGQRCRVPAHPCPRPGGTGARGQPGLAEGPRLSSCVPAPAWPLERAPGRLLAPALSERPWLGRSGGQGDAGTAALRGCQKLLLGASNIQRSLLLVPRGLIL